MKTNKQKKKHKNKRKKVEKKMIHCLHHFEKEYSFVSLFRTIDIPEHVSFFFFNLNVILNQEK